MRLKWFHILPIFLAIGFFAFLLNHIPLDTNDPPIEFSPPRLDLYLADTTIDEILANPKNVKYPNNTITLTDHDASTTFNNVELKGRGNSTWGWSKSPFQIKFDQKVDLFNMGAAKKYILLANFLDKSNLRNDIAFKLEQMLDVDYALKGQFVELYIDDSYQGLYYLTEKIEIDKNRINLKDELAIIVELENLHAATENCYRTKENTCLIIHDLRDDANESLAMTNFMEAFNALEQAAKVGDYVRVLELADVDSFAKYYLLSELTVNPDAYSSSLYFYKNGPNDKIHVAPGWDFDQAFGSHVWTWSRTEDYYSPETTRVIEKYAYGGRIYDEVAKDYVDISPDGTGSKLFFDLYHIPNFNQQVTAIFNELIQPYKEELIGYVSSLSSSLSDAATEDRTILQQYDKIILPNIGTVKPVQNDSLTKSIEQDINTNSITIAPIEDDIIFSHLSPNEAYWAEANRLIDWLSRRIDHLDYEFNGMDALPNELS